MSIVEANAPFPSGYFCWLTSVKYLLLMVTLKGLILNLSSYLNNKILYTFTVKVILLIGHSADVFNFTLMFSINSYNFNTSIWYILHKNLLECIIAFDLTFQTEFMK